MSSPQESNAVYREKELLYPSYLTTEDEAETFNNFLEPKLGYFKSTFSSESDMIDTSEQGDGQGGYYHYQLVAEEDHYRFEVARVEPHTGALLVGSEGWRRFAEIINGLDEAKALMKQRGGGPYIPADASPEDYMPQLYMSTEFILHEDGSMSKLLSSGYKVRDDWFTIYFGDGEYAGAEVGKPTDSEEELMGEVEADMVSEMTVEDMKYLLETLAQLGLYQEAEYEEDGDIIIPAFLQKNPIY